MKKKLIILAVMSVAVVITTLLILVLRPHKKTATTNKPLTEAAKQEVQQELSAVPWSAIMYNNWPESCYVVYDGYAYDITAYLGLSTDKKVLLGKYCGSDVTTVLNNQKDASGTAVKNGLTSPQAIKNAWQKYLKGKLQNPTAIKLK
jgi:cytochrome b involved in lipid metabolism